MTVTIVLLGEAGRIRTYSVFRRRGYSPVVVPVPPSASLVGSVDVVEEGPFPLFRRGIRKPARHNPVNERLDTVEEGPSRERQGLPHVQKITHVVFF